MYVGARVCYASVGVRLGSQRICLLVVVVVVAVMFYFFLCAASVVVFWSF